MRGEREKTGEGSWRTLFLVLLFLRSWAESARNLASSSPWPPSLTEQPTVTNRTNNRTTTNQRLENSLYKGPIKTQEAVRGSGACGADPCAMCSRRAGDGRRGKGAMEDDCMDKRRLGLG